MVGLSARIESIAASTVLLDFELPLSDEPNLVVKILEYAGVSIREAEVVQFAKGEETQNIQEESR